MGWLGDNAILGVNFLKNGMVTVRLLLVRVNKVSLIRGLMSSSLMSCSI